MTDDERKLLNKRLLAAARGGGNVEELMTDQEYRDAKDEYLFDINCTDILGNTPLHLAVQSKSEDIVGLILEAPLCDVDVQNNAGDTPLHLAVQIMDPEIRKAIVEVLINEAEAYDSTRLMNKAGQTPKDLCEICCPDDSEVIKLASPPARTVYEMLDRGDIACDDDIGSSD